MGDSSVSPIENQDQMLRAVEEKQRSVFNAIELVLSIGDFQKQVDHPIELQEFVKLTADRINQIIRFDVSAIYIVDQETSDIKLYSCIPSESKNELENQMQFLIEHGYIAWALREQRGIMVYSNDVRYRVLLHAMATYSRIRGIFVGLFPVKSKRFPNASLQALSLMLRNAANALESLEYIEMYKRQNAELHTRVDEKVGELRRRDLQLLNAQKMDAVAALAGGVAHQYNNALFALTGNLDLIRLGITDSQEIEKCIDRIDSLTQRMNDLTLKLLAYARGGKYKPQTITINALVENALKELEKPLEGITDLVLMPPSDTFFVHVDVTQMQLALSAIVTNATEAIEQDGRISISWEKLPIEASTQEPFLEQAPGDYVVLGISDNGRGMDDITRQRIFEPFFTTKFHGRGLSMAAVYGIVKNHDGLISVESEAGKGTTVRIYLPMAN